MNYLLYSYSSFLIKMIWDNNLEMTNEMIHYSLNLFSH